MGKAWLSAVRPGHRPAFVKNCFQRCVAEGRIPEQWLLTEVSKLLNEVRLPKHKRQRGRPRSDDMHKRMVAEVLEVPKTVDVTAWAPYDLIMQLAHPLL